MELADVLDSKSSGSDTVRVRPPLPAPKIDRFRPVDFLSIAKAMVYHRAQACISSPKVYIISRRLHFFSQWWYTKLRFDDMQFLWNWLYTRLSPWFMWGFEFIRKLIENIYFIVLTHVKNLFCLPDKRGFLQWYPFRTERVIYLRYDILYGYAEGISIKMIYASRMKERILYHIALAIYHWKRYRFMI